MSDAALTIWISCGSLLVSTASLVVSVTAHRRSDALRRLDRLSELSTDIADLRPRLDQLERALPKAVQSRAPAAAALGYGLRAGADAAAVREPRSQLDGAASTPRRVDSAGIETKSVTSRQVSTGLELERTISKAEPSRAPGSAALGHGPRAAADAAVRESRGQVDRAASTPRRVDYAGIDIKSVTARQVSTRLEQLVHYMRERAGRPR